MKYNIFNYNQQKAIELGLDLKDLLILEWFQIFQPRMHKTIRSQKQYYWINYTAMLKDIPILEIQSEKGLYKRMQKMCEIGILEYLPIRTAQGCYAYYLITDLVSILISSHSPESSSGSPESSSGSPESSDAIYNSHTIDSHTIDSSNTVLLKKEQHSPSSSKEIYSQDFIDFFNFYEKPQKQTGKTARKDMLYKKYKLALKENTAEEMMQYVKDYLLHLQYAAWKQKKDLLAWLNNGFYQQDWKSMCQEEQKKQGVNTQKQTQEYNGIYKLHKNLPDIVCDDLPY